MRELHRPSTTQADKSLTPAPGITNTTLPAASPPGLVTPSLTKGEPLMSLDAEAVAGRVRESSRLGRLEDLFSGWSPSGIAWPSHMLYRLWFRYRTGHPLTMIVTRASVTTRIPEYPAFVTAPCLQIRRGRAEPSNDAKSQVVASRLSVSTRHVPSAGAGLIAVLIFRHSALPTAKMV
jgi:hypothetical protein